ncbi:N-acetyltransferase [Hyphomicrobium sp.]|uniref:N-acetyltransferase n=1 Tax=Hyphomicrobium sp. TaxID=82 RepID=UPI001D35503C|nr:N-acetyltransferase [Hyphomicrobium sp.]MBY0560421.1 N-acetyltransferase [Hyphomicrobium sp.]
MSERLQKAEASYSRLMAQHAKSDFDPMEAETRLRALVLDKPLVPLTTKNGRVFFLRRALTDAGMLYRIFRTELSAVIGEEAVGSCEVGHMVNGIALITKAEVQRSFQRKGIATAVYDLISADMVHAGGLLWPVSPRQMSDAEFKVWWRRSPVLVFYYPHRHRLGLTPRFEFDELFDGATSRRTFRETARACFHALVSRFKWVRGQQFD